MKRLVQISPYVWVQPELVEALEYEGCWKCFVAGREYIVDVKMFPDGAKLAEKLELSPRCVSPSNPEKGNKYRKRQIARKKAVAK